MKFNFGATPFKHEPVAGHVAIDQAADKNSKVSTIVGSAPVAAKVKANNAPYAIIMEVSNCILQTVDSGMVV